MAKRIFHICDWCGAEQEAGSVRWESEFASLWYQGPCNAGGNMFGIPEKQAVLVCQSCGSGFHKLIEDYIASKKQPRRDR